MPYGLKDIEFAKLNEVFAANERIERVVLYGSRAKGNYKPFSDVDITLEGAELTHTDLSRLSLAIDDLLLPYQFDISIFHTLKNEALIDHIRRMGITIYEKKSEWKEYKLGEIVAFGNGKERPKAKGHVPVYGGNGILDYTSEYNYDGETVIIGRVGAYCGSVYYADCPIWVSDNALAVKAKDNNSPKFLYYFLRNLKLNDYAEGSSHPLVTQRLLNSIDIRFPNDVKEQNSIAAILSSLDDKIDLLHRENATLEQMAETLFRQWFVVEAKEEWEEGKLGDYVVETIGGEWGKENSEGDYLKAVQCIRGTDIADLNVGLADRTPIRFVKESKFEKIEPRNGDIIMEVSGGTENQSTGRVAYINEDVKTLFQYPIVFSNFSRLLRVNEKYTYFLYCYLKYLYDQDEFFNLENGSSGIKNLDYKALLYELTYTMPKEEGLILEFNEKVSPFFIKINKNKKQIQTLNQTRDGLLPRLMSGEVII